MKEKLDTIETNLIMLIRKLEGLKCTKELNYDLFRELEQINEKLGEVEMLIQGLEEIEDL